MNYNEQAHFPLPSLRGSSGSASDKLSTGVPETSVNSFCPSPVDMRTSGRVGVCMQECECGSVRECGRMYVGTRARVRNCARKLTD